MKLYKIAIIGNGFSGLSTTYYLSKLLNNNINIKNKISSIDIYDVKKIGGSKEISEDNFYNNNKYKEIPLISTSSSGSEAACGLIHPLTYNNKLSLLNFQLFSKAKELINELINYQNNNKELDNNNQLNFINFNQKFLYKPIYKENELNNYIKNKDYYNDYIKLYTKHIDINNNKNNNEDEDSIKTINNLLNHLNNNRKCLGVLKISSFYHLNNPSNYLKLLWNISKNLNKDLFNFYLINNNNDFIKFNSNKLRESYDKIILCNGVGLPYLFNELKKSQPKELQPNGDLSFMVERGDSLLFYPNNSSNNSVDLTSNPLLYGEYLVTLDSNHKLGGATHKLVSNETFLEPKSLYSSLISPPSYDKDSEEELLQKLTELDPSLLPLINTSSSPSTSPSSSSSISSSKLSYQRYSSGYRLLLKRTHHGRLPMCGILLPSVKNQSQDKNLSEVWALGGFASRGLLYHAYLGETLAKSIINSIENEKEIENLIKNDIEKKLNNKKLIYNNKNNINYLSSINIINNNIPSQFWPINYFS